MALDDYMEPEVGVAIAATALIASPQVRGFLRRGAVYGMAGLMMAGDAAASFARAAGRSARQAADEATEMADDMTEDMTAAEATGAAEESPIIVPSRPRARAGAGTRRAATTRRRAAAPTGGASANA